MPPSALEDKRIINILMLSLGFMLVFVSFQTMSNILITLVNSMKADSAGYYGDPFYALAIVYGVLALFNFLVPPIISVLGTRISMVLGSICYALYIISFFITSGWMLYVASVILGIGAATIWTAQGTYLTLNSDAYTIARNSAIFWAAFQSSTLFGNTFVFFTFQDKQVIDPETRTFVYSVLAAICLVGVFILMLLRPPLNVHGNQISDSTNAPSRAFTRAFAMIGTRDMLLLFFSFWFTDAWGIGANLAFAASVYSSWIGNTPGITQPDKTGTVASPKTLIGLIGILFGVGEVLGGSLFGVLADITTFQWGRNPIVIFGSLVLLAAYVLIYLNIPPIAALFDPASHAFGNSSGDSASCFDPFAGDSAKPCFDPPRKWIAMLCSFFLGLGDSCFNTQIYSIVATIYREDAAPPFAMFKFVQSIASGVAFLFFKYVPLRLLLIALAVMDVLAAITFYPVEVDARTPYFEPDELHIQIPAGPSVDRVLVTVAKDEKDE